MMRKWVCVSGLAGVALLGVAMPAAAEVVTSPVQALKLLVEARVAGDKCGWLDAAKRRELDDYAARAELMAVRRAGAAAAKRAVAEGRRLGNAGCSAEKREKTLAVLHGAREAMRARAGSARSTARRMARRTVQRRTVQQRTVQQRTVQRRTVQQRKPMQQRVARVRSSAREDALLRRYRRLAAAYYNALKCRNRPHGELMGMWREVRDLHLAILRRGEKSALARAKEGARRAGVRRGCRRG